MPRALGVAVLALGVAGTIPVAAAPSPARICDPKGDVVGVVTLASSPGVALVGLKLRLQYPPSVGIPGRADEPSVKERVQILPGGVLFSPNDDDESLVVALVGTEPLPHGQLMNVRFDRCGDSKAPRARDFVCRVEQGSDQAGTLVTKGITCAFALGNEKEKGR